MITALQNAREHLLSAENSLKSSVIAALNTGRYDEVPRLTEVLTSLRALVESLPASSSPEEVVAESDEALADSESTVSPQDEEEPREVAKRPQRTDANRRAREKYPQFFIRDDQLVKLGWSPNSAKEYEHRVPKAGVDAFAEYLGSLRRSRFPITAETIAKALQKEESQRILGYQVYVVAGWLKSLKLLVPEGRQGYFLKKDVDLTAEVSKAWAKLESSSSSS